MSHKVVDMKENRWKCPKCGRSFGKAGQSHYCGEVKTIDEYIETSAEFDDFDEFKEEVMDEISNSMRGKFFIPTDRLYEIATDIYQDAWEGLSSCGRFVNCRVYLWAIGFYMAVTQLEEQAIL